MKKLLSLLLLSLLIPRSFSQIDSLEALLPSLPPEKKVFILGELTFQLSVINIDKSLKYGYQSLAIAKTLGNDSLLAVAYNDLSLPYFFKGIYDSVIFYNKKSLDIRMALNDKVGIAANFSKIGSAYYEMGDLKNAMRFHMKSLEAYDALKDTLKMGMTLNSIGSIMHRNKNYATATKFFKMAEEAGRKYGNLITEYTAIGNSANAYQRMGDYKMAIYYFERIIHDLEEYGNTEIRANAYQGLGVVYRDLGLHQKGLEYYKLGLDIYKEIGSDIGVGLSYINMGNAYLDLKDEVNSEKYLKMGLAICESQAVPYQLKIAYEAMYNFAKKRNDIPNALKYIEKYSSIKDSIYNEESQSVLATMSAQFEQEKSRKELAESKLRLANSELLLRKRTILAMMILGGLVFVVLGLMYFIKRQQTKRKILEQENQLKLVKERYRISRDLHDNLGAELTMISFLAENQGLVDDRWREVGDHTRSAMTQLRETIWAIHEQEIPLIELCDRVRDHARKMFALQKVELSIKAEETDWVLQPNQTLHLYRICQEIINNSAKYSCCNIFTLQFRVDGNECKVFACDNGVGFDMNNEMKGYGFTNMKSRVEELNGHMQMESSQGNGTRIWISLPMDL